ncbi:MAG TPA: autotransporter domain-containing protein [Steroidobacteraceae bacterium]|nr:autotransporter domain-containing protein [Steroidobacteraceae bacterium]
MRNRKQGARARRALYVPAVLVAAAAVQDASAATAQNQTFQTPGSSVPTFTFNVVANNLAASGSRPVQLVSASADLPNHTVVVRLNCIQVTRPAGLDSRFVLTYTVADGVDTPTTRATGTLTFDPLSNNLPPALTALSDKSCIDQQDQEAVPVDDTATVGRGQVGIISVLANDTNADPNVSRIVLTGAPTSGTAVVQGTNVLYTPAPGFLGTAQFSYQLSEYSLYPDYRNGAATVTITVANQVPIANAGPDQTLSDTDLEPGENVVLDGRASTDTDGTIATYVWRNAAGTQIATGANPTVRLPDGSQVITLTVTDDAGIAATDTVTINVATAPTRTTLSEIPDLTPNQRKMAQALDSLCPRLSQAETLTSEQAALLTRCNGLSFNNSVENQRQALDELNGDDFSAARTQTLLFANFQYVGVMDRLIALRGGARGLSLAGLDLMLDGKHVPLAELQEMVGGFLGGGAASDAAEPGGLLSDKLGLWGRGNYSFGNKDASAAAPKFDADQWGLLLGMDYRFSDKAVGGVALAYGDSSVEFQPAGEGKLDATSWAVSLYGSMYAAKNFYLDAILNYASVGYDAQRNITYVDGTGLVSENAHGDTDGATLSGGASLGYDFLLGGLTLSPTAGVFYVDATIDGFTENGAPGINLAYDEQNFKSFTGNLGLRLTYAWNLSWGVLLPHLRTDFVREFEDQVEVFGVRFAADPFDAGSNPTPPILVETDNPDRSYWRLAAGFSAQFKHGVSGYIEYQRLESYELINFQDVSLGLRFQRSF